MTGILGKEKVALAVHNVFETLALLEIGLVPEGKTSRICIVIEF